MSVTNRTELITLRKHTATPGPTPAATTSHILPNCCDLPPTGERS